LSLGCDAEELEVFDVFEVGCLGKAFVGEEDE
jgi:hypothetical protein